MKKEDKPKRLLTEEEIDIMVRELLTIPQANKFFGMRIDDLIDRGQITVTKIGSKKRISKQVVYRWIWNNQHDESKLIKRSA